MLRPHTHVLRLDGAIHFVSTDVLSSAEARAAAAAAGYALLGVTDEDHRLATRCHGCGTPGVHPAGLAPGALPRCAACLDRRTRAALACLKLSRVPGAEDLIRRPCGHTHAMEDAAIREAGAAGALPPCPACREAHYGAIAAPEWDHVGPAPCGDPELRLYKAALTGEERVAAPIDVYRGHVRPAWVDGPCPTDPRPPHWPVIAGLYLLEVETAVGPALKLGHSCDVIRRAGAFNRVAPYSDWPGHVVELPRRDVRHHEEQVLHRMLLASHPDLALSREEIGRDLPCVSEVYRPEAKPLITSAFRRIAARYACYDGRHGVIAPDA